MDDLITEIHYEIKPPEAWASDVPDRRTIYTLLEMPEAHAALEEKFAPRKIEILAYAKKRYLPAPTNNPLPRL